MVTEAKFLGGVSDRALSYKNHAHYLKANCLKAPDILKVVGHTDWGEGGGGWQIGKLYFAFSDL